VCQTLRISFASDFAFGECRRQAKLCNHIPITLGFSFFPLHDYEYDGLLRIFHAFMPCRSQMGGACFSTQLIDGDGVFNVSKLENFMKEVRLGACRLSYAIVSIMGPQSSGMRSLFFPLFRLCLLDISVCLISPSSSFSFREKYTSESSFGPNVRETDAFKGRCATIPIYLSLNFLGCSSVCSCVI
jgi:hypothetical protein